MLRIPSELHRALKAAAARAGVSLNSYCQSALATAVRGGAGSSGDGIMSAALVAAIAAEFDDVLVGLVMFGSRTRNEHTATSDIDLLIAVSESAAVSRELYTRWDTAVDADAGMASPHFAQLPSDDTAIGSLWLEVALHGVVLLDRSGAVARTLARVRDRIAAGDVQRRFAYGHPYWIHTGRDA